MTSADGGSFSTDNPVGYEGYQVLGFAPILAFETRDSQTYPRKGVYAEILLMSYPDWLYRSFHFFNFRIDARKYYPVNWMSDHDVIAVQLFITVNKGNVPFIDMADLGGSNVMRGYYTGYYRYKNLYAFQTEYRASVWKFIGVNVWVGAAMTPEKWHSPGGSSIKPKRWCWTALFN